MRRKRKGLRFKEEEKGQNIVRFYEIGGWIFGILFSILMAFILVYSLGMKTRMIGDSMEPELKNGQEIFMNRIIYGIIGPERESVIVFKPNGNENSHYYVKRVIGLPGERVQIKEGKIYIEGKIYEEEGRERIKEPGLAEQEIELGLDEYFVLGDNRDSSEDSRSANVGNVQRDTIVGKAWFKLPIEEGDSGLVQ